MSIISSWRKGGIKGSLLTVWCYDMSGIYDMCVSAFPMCLMWVFSHSLVVGVSQLASDLLWETCCTRAIHFVCFWEEGSRQLTPMSPTWSTLTFTNYFYLQPTRNNYHENGRPCLYYPLLNFSAWRNYWHIVNTLISTSSLIIITILKGNKC